VGGLTAGRLVVPPRRDAKHPEQAVTDTAHDGVLPYPPKAKKKRLSRFVLPRGLLGRSLLLIIAPVVLLQAVTTYAFYERHWDAVTKWLARGVVGEISYAIDELAVRTTPADQQRLFDQMARHMQIAVTLDRGQQLAAYAAPPQSVYSLLDRILSRVIEERIGRPYHLDSQRDDDQVEIRVQLEEGVLRAMTREKRLYSATTYVFLAWMFGSAFVLVTIAILFLRSQILPIRDLAKAADNFGKGRDVADFRPRGAREIRRAGNAFLIMKNRILRQIQQRTEMLAGVSHDLRTPLTRMKLQLAMLGDSEDIHDLKRDVSEMERMVQAYLAFARGQDGEAATPTDLSLLLAEVVTDAGRKGEKVQLKTEPMIRLPLRPVAFRRCLNNLIDNATRHATTVAITARKLPDAVVLTVDDDGPGIPENRREDVFRPFRRLDEARNQDDGGGVGLGLTIARDVVRGHGGEIQLLDSPQGGLRVLIRIPV